MLLQIVYILLMLIVAGFVARAIIRQLPTWLAHSNPATASRRWASVCALTGFALFVVLAATQSFATSSLITTVRLVIGVGVDLSLVMGTTFYDDFYLRILFGPQDRRLQFSRIWKLIGCGLVAFVTSICVWQALLHHEGETAARLYTNPSQSLWLIAYRLVCLVWCSVFMARTISYGALYRRVSQDPVARLSIFFTMLANGSCVAALVIAVGGLFVPATTPLATVSLLLTRLGLVLFLIFAFLSSRALTRHFWHLRAFWAIDPLWRTLTYQPSAGGFKGISLLRRVALHPRTLSLLLRQRVIAILDARRRQGVVTPAHALSATSGLSVPGEDLEVELALANDTYQPWSETPHLGQQQTNEERQLAIREAQYLLAKLKTSAQASPTDRIEIEFPHIPRALWYPQQVRYLQILSRSLCELQQYHSTVLVPRAMSSASQG